MQDEINEKVVALSVKGAKLTAEMLQKAIKAAANGKQLAGEVSPRRKPRRLSRFIKEKDKEQIRQIGKYQPFQIYAFHRSMPPSCLIFHLLAVSVELLRLVLKGG